MHHSIEIEGLSFSYPDGHQALSGVSLVIQPGEKVALVGPNGAGKSTLILHLNGILSGDGSVRVCGIEVEGENLGRVRAMVGMVFQSPEDQLFSPKVFDDVAFGPLYQGWPIEKVQARVEESLASVGMSDYVDRVSHHLSMGEKKRIAIATVLSMKPEVLVLDEPTAGLDPVTAAEIDDLILNINKNNGTTIAIVTHELASIFALAKRVIMLDKRKKGIIAEGDPATLKQNSSDPFVRNFFNRQVRAENEHRT